MSRKDFSQINTNEFKHSTAIQIRFADIDKMGHVNNATILSYFELARTKYFDAIIGKHEDWFMRGLIIGRTEIDYFQPVYLEDETKVYVRVSKVGTKSFGVEHVLVKQNNQQEIICAIGTSVLVCMDYHKKQTIAVPDDWKAKFI